MVKRHAIDCDMCGAEDIESIEFCLTVGRDSLPTGEKVDDVKNVDICVRCAPRFLRFIKDTVSISYKNAEEILDRVKKNRHAAVTCIKK